MSRGPARSDGRAGWAPFLRMQASLVATGALAFAAGLVERARPHGALFPGDGLRLIAIPSACLLTTLAVVLGFPPLRRMVRRHLLASYATGFGQSVISVLVGLGVILAAGAFLVWRVRAAAAGGHDPAGAFSGFGAGVGLLIAQSLLARQLAREALR